MSLPKLECDLVMKGGVTSGVVFPLAITSLAEKYRFQNIGGTSAGAMSAVTAAAAEYARQTGNDKKSGLHGFDRIAKIPSELGEEGRLLNMFQPLPVFKPLLNVLLGFNQSRSLIALVKSVASNFSSQLALGAVPGVAILIWAVVEWNVAGMLLGFLLSVIGAIGYLAFHIYRLIAKELPRNDFGMCTGRTQEGYEDQALTDWLANLIDETSGKTTTNCIDLSEQGIEVRTVTTDLTTRRPYSLPIDTNTYYFSKTEFNRLFPEDVVDAMAQTRVMQKDVNDKDVPATHYNDILGIELDDFYYFQDTAPGTKNVHTTPLIVLARMSLSFPFLFCAVPLYRKDHTKAESHRQKLVRCLFSDGGLSSNFPIHFFDRFLPSTPTFGISLTEFDTERLRPGQSEEDPAARVHLPTKAGSGRDIPTFEFKDTMGFFWAMFSSAKDWQDTLQSALPGNRERIVTIALKPDEGGLNLNMDQDKVDNLIKFGKAASAEVNQRFHLDEYRWRRYLVETAVLEEAISDYSGNFSADTQENSLPFKELITTPLDAPDSGYKLSKTQREKAVKRTSVITESAAELKQIGKFKEVKGVPKTRSRLRNIADMGNDGGETV